MQDTKFPAPVAPGGRESVNAAVNAANRNYGPRRAITT